MKIQTQVPQERISLPTKKAQLGYANSARVRGRLKSRKPKGEGRGTKKKGKKYFSPNTENEG